MTKSDHDGDVERRRDSFCSLLYDLAGSTPCAEAAKASKPSRPFAARSHSLALQVLSLASWEETGSIQPAERVFMFHHQ